MTMFSGLEDATEVRKARNFRQGDSSEFYESIWMLTKAAHHLRREGVIRHSVLQRKCSPIHSFPLAYIIMELADLGMVKIVHDAKGRLYQWTGKAS